MKKNTTTKYRPNFTDIFIIFIAFILGAMLYFFGAIGVDKITPRAGAATGAWQQVTVRVGVCDCITEFIPDPILPGDGTVDNPFISNNTRVSMAVRVSGAGHITIEDENGNILYQFNQSIGDNPERIVDIDFPSVGKHKLIIKINGAEISANGISTELNFQIGKLPPIIPDLPWVPGLPGVPSTGGYVYIAGYAVQIWSLIVSGIIVAIIAWFLLLAYRRKQKINETHIRVYEKKPRRRLARSRKAQKKPTQAKKR